ncbi:MAG: hypothetical protein ACYDBT_02780 [Desulfobulbaceae bacterium]
MRNPVVLRTISGRRGLPGSCFCLVVLPVLLLLVLLMPPLASGAGAEVSAAYTQAQGTLLVVEIRVGAPPPSSLILVQNLPPGVTLLGAQPPANNVNPGKGEAKWLLRDIAAGQFTIRMTLDRPVATGEIAAEVRYMPARGGGMQTLPVAKP